MPGTIDPLPLPLRRFPDLNSLLTTAAIFVGLTMPALAVDRLHPIHMPSAVTTEIVIQDGDTLAGLLQQQKISPQNRRAVLSAIDDVFDGGSLQPTSVLKLTFAPQVHEIATAELLSRGTSAFKVAIDVPQTAVAATAPAEDVDAGPSDHISQEGVMPTAKGQFVVHHVTGPVGTSFREALRKVRVPADLIDQIMLGFRNKSGQAEPLSQNAKFDVVYEGFLQGSDIAEPRLRSAMVKTALRTRRIYRYQTDEATTAIVQEDGQGIALIDLGQPLHVAERVTSPFGWRIHPVFGDRRFHEGVDFGAPTGTPVFAASDGVVEDIGYRGNYGDYIRLRRDGHLQTAYAHLSSFVRGLRKGDTVRRGDVIAYVGRTGVATGPHLYYEVLIDGKQVDPMKAAGVPVNLTGTQLAEFQKFVDRNPEE